MTKLKQLRIDSGKSMADVAKALKSHIQHTLITKKEQESQTQKCL